MLDGGGRRLVGLVEVAHILGFDRPTTVGRRKVERLIKSERCSLIGEDHGARARAHWRVRLEEVERYKAERAQQDADPATVSPSRPVDTPA